MAKTSLKFGTKPIISKRSRYRAEPSLHWPSSESVRGESLRSGTSLLVLSLELLTKVIIKLSVPELVCSEVQLQVLLKVYKFCCHLRLFTNSAVIYVQELQIAINNVLISCCMFQCKTPN